MNEVPTAPQRNQVRRLTGKELACRLPALEACLLRRERFPLSQHPRWLSVLAEGLQQVPWAIEAMDGHGETVGFLPLMYVKSWLFGRFLVSLPYLNTNGVLAEDAVAPSLVDEAIRLAGELQVRQLELRHERALAHSGLNSTRTDKVHMRLALPDFPGPLWEGFKASVRNQVRKGEKSELTVSWGGQDQLDAFYSVFSRNMRDLGTPVYGRGLFRSILAQFPGEAELCVVRQGNEPVAGALLLHGRGVTEVPSASSLRQYSSTCANMLMYWHLLERAVLRGQKVFDFGRSTEGSSTWKFKKQWGAKPEPAVWQYHERTGSAGDVRPDNPRFQRLIALWRRLPLRLTRWLGPVIVRGIP
jgi:FemAB-related protein (PEP-CTERM system-associated)